jgi:hypothetical protein
LAEFADVKLDLAFEAGYVAVVDFDVVADIDHFDLFVPQGELDTASFVSDHGIDDAVGFVFEARFYLAYVAFFNHFCFNADPFLAIL